MKYYKEQLRQNQSGMTLIEIIIVIAMIALLMSLGVVVLNDLFQANLEKITSELSGTIRYTYDESAIKNKTYRLKVDLTTQTISVEATSESVKAGDESESSSETPSADENSPPPSGGFSTASSYLLQPIQLPEGVRIKDIYVAHLEKKIDTGSTAIYFFPNGWVEKAVINLCDEKDENCYSIETHSLTGKTTIRHEYWDYRPEDKK